jgi:cytoskeletal protein CcmA (bactofilin family)
MTFTKSIKLNILFAVLVLSVFIFSALIVSANTVVRSGDVVSIAEDQVIDGDFYGAAGTVSISGVIEEDFVATGGQITLNGEIGADAFLLAGGVDIHGSVGDDLRIIAGEVTIAEPINGDLFIIAGDVDILSSASIEGDVLIYGGEVTIAAPVKGDILGNMGSLRIDSLVEGNVDVTVSNLTLGDRANISGSISYISHNEMIQALNSSVAGELIRNDPVIPQQESSTWAWIVPGLVLVFSALVWYLISRKTLNIVVDKALVKSPKPLLLGTVVLLFLPVAVLLLLVSMIGSIVGLVLLFTYLIVITLSFVALMAVLGQLFQIGMNRSKQKVSLLTMLIGFVGYGLFSMLPAIGQTVLFILMLITLGAIVDLVISSSKNK